MRAAICILVIVVIGLSWPKGKESPKQGSQIENDLIGKYGIRGFNSAVYLELTDNGTFLYETGLWGCTGGGLVKRIRGNFSAVDKRLYLLPESLITTSYLGFDHMDVKRDSGAYYESDSTYFKREYHLVKWDSMSLLLSTENYSPWGHPTDENDFESFANDFNSGYGPLIGTFYFIKAKRHYRPEQTLDLTQIPPAYRDYFLRQPISGEIINVGASDHSDLFGNKKNVLSSTSVNRTESERKWSFTERMDAVRSTLPKSRLQPAMAIFQCATMRMLSVTWGVG